MSQDYGIDPVLGETTYEMEALQKAAKERKEIVGRYLKGEDSEDDEDHWEDSAFSLYKITDRYGFLHEKELPEIPSLEEEKRKQTEMKRLSKWLKMLNKWPSYSSNEKLRSRVYKGIPLSLRGDAWKLMLNVADLMKEKPRTYEEMKERSQLHSSDIKQIDVDVNRTYRNHIMFRKRYSIKQQQLFFVLAAYSMYNTEVGYCQGMSQIAALLLMYMSEEEAFWALHSLLYGKKHRMHGFFIPGFPKLLRFQDHHDKILKKFVPRLKKHLDKNEIFASLYTMKWFFQCFLDRSPFPLTLRLWDVYVLEGERILVAMSYTTLKMHKTIIKKMEMDEIVSFLQERLAENFGSDDDYVIEQLRLNLVELKKAKMDLPPAAGDNESAKLPFGTAVKHTFAQETGIRVPAAHMNNSVEETKSKSKRTSEKIVTNSKESNGDVGHEKPKEPARADHEGKNSGDSSRRHRSKQEETTGDDKKKKKEDSRKSGKRESLKKEKRRSEQRSLEKEKKNLDSPIAASPPVAAGPASPNHSPKKSEPHRKEPGSNPGHVIAVDERAKQVNASSSPRIENSSDSPSKSPLDDDPNTRVKFEWKVPKSQGRLHSNGGSASLNEPSSPRHRTSQVDKKSKKRTDEKRKKSDRNLSSEAPQDNSDSIRDESDSYSAVAPIAGQGGPSAFNELRPFSLYDNILGSTHASRDSIPRISAPDTSTTSESVYQSKMEESLENLRELVASLPVSPSSPYRHQPSSRSAAPLSSSSDSKRRQSYDVIDGDESGLSSLDEVARNLSRSAELLELKQKQTDSSRSAFRQAVVGAGIMQLPKRPSSTALNAVLSPNTSESIAVDAPGRSSDLWVANPLIADRAKNSGQWRESDLSAREFVPLDGNFESHPISVNLSAMSRNANNNHRETGSARHVSSANQSKHRSGRRIDSKAQSSRRGAFNAPDHSLRGESETDTATSSRHRHLPPSHSMDHTASRAPADCESSRHRHQRLDEPTEHRVQIRPQAPAAEPPSYSTTASRYYSAPTHAAPAPSSWSRTRRKNSSTIAVQTDATSFYDGSLV